MTLVESPATSVRFPWMADAMCHGHTALFFGESGERPEGRAQRVEQARRICHVCPVMLVCRAHARVHREYGLWGGETEEERAAAGSGPPGSSRWIRRRRSVRVGSGPAA
jgi:WhiB family transcriptional regulator, redox-sensing transcriptional regulator